MRTNLPNSRDMIRGSCVMNQTVCSQLKRVTLDSIVHNVTTSHFVKNVIEKTKLTRIDL